ncbi:MetQ/NlpA family ABC transporter substrate-binding protein [Hutsoniella sourekii]|uniref:MetQ/NlpA family ABC transporter substrate-binding protein n=1 Tax=Hutsoniella sourekii TaxID=87650 RepID=UPI000489628C|nr:MetQ/NlpA family ABC transporter substrate-binding protein [Hutsoniella sourekii]
MQKWLKKLIITIFLLGLFIPTTLIQAQTVVKVAVIGDSTNGIWDLVQQNLDQAGEDIKIELVSFTDGVYANAAQYDGELDLTAFQHNAFLAQENEEKGYGLVAIGDTFISPMNIFSEQIDSLDQIKAGDSVSIPNNVTNQGRALYVLDRAGLIKLDEEVGFTPDIHDIKENPLNLEIKEVAPENILPTLPDVTIGITNSDFALDYGLDPVEDAVFHLDFDPNDEAFKPYVNIITARKEDKDNPTYQAIVKAYQQDNVYDYILDTFNNAMVPVWK